MRTAMSVCAAATSIPAICLTMCLSAARGDGSSAAADPTGDRRRVARVCHRFEGLCAATGLPSIPLEQLLRALLWQTLYSVRSERMRIDQLKPSCSGGSGDERPLDADDLHNESQAPALGPHRGSVLPRFRSRRTADLRLSAGRSESSDPLDDLGNPSAHSCGQAPLECDAPLDD